MDRNWFSHVESVVIVVTLIGGYFMIDSKFDMINSRFDQFMIAQYQESKDFHGRLCAIEERNKGK